MWLGDEIVVFNSNQFKNSDNLNPTENEDIRYQYQGINKDGIEVYETSIDTMSLTWKDRVDKLVNMLNNDYIGRTAKFIRNGHTYYAEFDRENLGKTVFGENHFSQSGKKAYLKAGADGDIFQLIENSEFVRSKKDTKEHKTKDKFTDYFDYFIKTVQIDNKVYNLNATVKKKYGERNGYTYTLYLSDNKKIKASPAVSTRSAFKEAGNTFDNNISQSSPNSQENSLESFDKMQLSPINEEHPEAKWGLNFHDATGEHLAKVFDGSKKYETRNENASLDKSVINTWTGIVQTGNGKAKLVGYWQLGEGQLKPYSWLKAHAEELGNDGTDYEATEGESKWVYRILKTEKLDTPREVDTRGIRKRSLEGQPKHMYADIDVDKFDGAYYYKEKVKVKGNGASRLYSEAMTWNPNKIGVPFVLFSNNYICIFNEDRELFIIGKVKRINTHKENQYGQVDKRRGNVGSGLEGSGVAIEKNMPSDGILGYGRTSSGNGQVFGEKTQTNGQGNGRRYNESIGNAEILTNEASSNEDAFSMPKNQYEGATSDNRSILANALKTDNTIINKLHKHFAFSKVFCRKRKKIKWKG